MPRLTIGDLPKYLEANTLVKYNKAYSDALTQWKTHMPDELKAIIVETIKRGQSPVKGGKGQTGGGVRFTDYSASYKKQITFVDTAKQAEKKFGVEGLAKSNVKNSTQALILKFGKKLRPINLTLTGEMLKSIRSRHIKDGFQIYFTSPLAIFHTLTGAGKSRVKRKMLPVELGDEFTRLINKGIVDKFQSMLLNYLKR